MEEVSRQAFEIPAEHFNVLSLGRSGAGKTTLFLEFISKFHLISPREKAVFVFVYNIHPPELPKNPQTVYLMKGLPEVNALLDLQKQHKDKRMFLIIDDALGLFVNRSEMSNRYSSLITEHGRRNFSVFIACQDVFPRLDIIKLFRKNSSYTLLFNFNNDHASITLAGIRQLGKDNAPSFKKLYLEATQRPNGYVLIDNHIQSPERARFPARNFFFIPSLTPDQFEIVYRAKDALVYERVE